MSCGIASSQTIYWLLFTDTDDPGVGTASQNSYDIFRNLFRDNVNTVMRQNGFQIKEIDVKGSQLSPDRCRQEIKNLSCTPKDIIVYYSISHGAYNQQNDPSNPWPYMWMGADDQTNMVDLAWVHNQLKAKNPRFLLTVGMCCNSDFSGALQARYGNLNYSGESGLDDVQEDMIKELFLGKNGDILVTSTSPHHTSGCCAYRNKVYDLFTCCFALIFNEMLGDDTREHLSWEEFLTKVKGAVSKLSRDLNGDSRDFQDPIYKINWGGRTQNTPPPPQNQQSSQPPDSGTLEHVLAVIANPANSYTNRQNYRNSAAKAFDPNAVVKKMSKDGSKVMNIVDLPDWLDDIATSRNILNIVVVSYKTNQTSGKISEIKVKEILKITNRIN